MQAPAYTYSSPQENTIDVIARNEGTATERQTHAGGEGHAGEQTADLLAGRQVKGEGGGGSIRTEGSQTLVSAFENEAGISRVASSGSVDGQGSKSKVLHTTEHVKQASSIVIVAGKKAKPDGSTKQMMSVGGNMMGASFNSMHAAEWNNVLEIYQEQYGRTYYFGAESAEACEQWVLEINEAMRHAARQYEQSLNLSTSERLRLTARQLYDNSRMQMCISLLLLANFIISIIQCEYSFDSNEDHPEAEVLQKQFDLLEIVFTFVYLGELILNMYGIPIYMDM